MRLGLKKIENDRLIKLKVKPFKKYLQTERKKEYTSNTGTTH